jgi:hypothetical protein
MIFPVVFGIFAILYLIVLVFLYDRALMKALDRNLPEWTCKGCKKAIKAENVVELLCEECREHWITCGMAIQKCGKCNE